MKLIVCLECSSVFSLDFGVKECTCGASKGVYDSEGITACYSGDNAIPLAIDNRSLALSIKEQPDEGLNEMMVNCFVVAKKDERFYKVNESELE